MSTLSVNILSFNSASTLETCLRSVAWADEIIVFDSGSTDDSVEIAKRYTPHVHQTDWPGFAEQRERALKVSTQKWVLILDSDEAVEPKLARAIERVVKTPITHSGYFLKRRDMIGEKCARFAGVRRHIRLVLRDQIHIEHRPIHEAIAVKSGTVGALKEGVLLHEPFHDLEHIIEKNNQYTTLSVADIKNRKKGSLWRAIGHGLWCFFRFYILKGGFLDGSTGFVIVWARTQHSFARQIKLWYAQRPHHLTLKEAFENSN